MLAATEMFLVPMLDALIASAIVLLLSFGLFIIYGLFRVVNMAHGEMVMLGAYIASISQGAGFGFTSATLLAALFVGLVAVFMDMLCIGRLRVQSPVATLLATWGFALLISQSVRLLMGAGGRFVSAPFDAVVQVGGNTYPVYHLFLLVIAILISAATWFILVRTRLGHRVRATAEDIELAELSGIDSRTIFTCAFAIGGAMAGAAGAVLAPLYAINPFVGSQFSVLSFLAIIAGGLGNVFGPLLGAGVVGGAKSLINNWSNITISTFATLALVALLMILRKRDVELR